MNSIFKKTIGFGVDMMTFAVIILPDIQACLAALIIKAIISLIAAIPIYFLWNWLMPDLFDIKTVTFLQAWGIGFLANILFGPFKYGHSSSLSDKD